MLRYPKMLFVIGLFAGVASVGLVGCGSDNSGTDDSCDESEMPMCVVSCTGDVNKQPKCTDGSWNCPASSQRASTCSEDTCAGGEPPECVESCSDQDPVSGDCCTPTHESCGEPGYWFCPDDTMMRRDNCR
jgi:hypothetical protein